MNTEAIEQVGAPDVLRKPYAPPVLAEYGPIAVLTAGGTGPVKEVGFNRPKNEHP